jgi:hypothetical protein
MNEVLGFLSWGVEKFPGFSYAGTWGRRYIATRLAFDRAVFI